MHTRAAEPSQALVNRLAVFAYLATARGQSTPYDIAGRLVETEWPAWGCTSVPDADQVHAVRQCLYSVACMLACHEATDQALRVLQDVPTLDGLHLLPVPVARLTVYHLDLDAAEPIPG